MKEKLSLGNSLLLTAVLVGNLSLGISPSNAAVLAGDALASANTNEIIDRLDALDIDFANGNSSDRDIFLNEDLLSILRQDIDKNPRLLGVGNDIKSFIGNLSAEINDVFGANSETEFTPVAPVYRARSKPANIQTIYSIAPRKNPLKALLKSLSFVDSDPAKEGRPIPSYTGRVEPAAINPTPVSEDNTIDNTIETPPENQPAKEQTYTAAPSSQPAKTKTVLKLAQLPPAVQDDRESFDLLPLAGGAIGLGFFIWMLFQD